MPMLEETDALDAATAETVLLTLGAQLIWEPKTSPVAPPPGFVWEGATFIDGDRQQNYSVSVIPEWHGEQATVQTTYWMKGRGDKKKNAQEQPRQFSCLAAAKVACERHAATDEWSGMVETLWLKEPRRRRHQETTNQ